MNRVIFILKNPREFLWEPIRRQLFKARQLRAERDFWRGIAKDYEERHHRQCIARIKAEDERDALVT